MSKRLSAQVRVINATLRVLSNQYPTSMATYPDEEEYAWEQLELAARELTQAVEESDDKPVGW